MLLFCRIKAERFAELRQQLVELFPTIKVNLWYSPRTKNIRGETVASGGCLYNFYRAYRSELIEAGELHTKLTTTSNTTCDDEGKSQ